jgi:hypothetical protein
LDQTDITGAYLESYLHEDVYMEVPPDLRINGKPPKDAQGRELVCKLKRGIYGLKQSGHHWMQCFKTFLTQDPEHNMGFHEMTGEPNMYRKRFELNGRMEEVILGVYVDDCLIASSSPEAREWFMSRLKARFPVNPKSSGSISFDEPGLLLSMNVRYDIKTGILQLDQKQAIELLAAKLQVIGKPPRSLPIPSDLDLPKLKTAEVDPIEYLSIIGSCLHIAQVSRPDIAYAVGYLARHSATPGVAHRQAAIDLVNYLYATRELYIEYRRSAASGNIPEMYEKGYRPERDKGEHDGNDEIPIEKRLVASVPIPAANKADVFIDSDYAGDKDTRRSTSGFITMFNGGPVSWQSRLQKLCAQSSAEAEIYAVVDSVKEALHIRLLCEECEVRKPGIPVRVYEDNNACIMLGHGLRGSKAAKHFEVSLRMLHEHVRDKSIEFARIDTKDQLADGFTKALPGPAFLKFRNQVLKGHTSHFVPSS